MVGYQAPLVAALVSTETSQSVSIAVYAAVLLAIAINLVALVRPEGIWSQIKPFFGVVQRSIRHTVYLRAATQCFCCPGGDRANYSSGDGCDGLRYHHAAAATQALGVTEVQCDSYYWSFWLYSSLLPRLARRARCRDHRSCLTCNSLVWRSPRVIVEYFRLELNIQAGTLKPAFA